MLGSRRLIGLKGLLGSNELMRFNGLLEEFIKRMECERCARQDLNLRTYGFEQFPGRRKRRNPASILMTNRTGTGQHSAIELQVCNPPRNLAPTPNGYTPHLQEQWFPRLECTTRAKMALGRLRLLEDSHAEVDQTACGMLTRRRNSRRSLQRNPHRGSGPV